MKLKDLQLLKKLQIHFFKLTLLTEVTQLSRYMAYSAMRKNLLDDAIRAQADNSLSKPTVDGNKAASRLQKIYGIANPKTNKTLTEWIESSGKDNPTLINRALSKAVDDNIMAPNTVNKPLLMSNPNYALVFQLKAFLTVFGNTVGFRIWRDITTPMYGGKAGGLPKNPEAAVKAALSLAMIMTVSAAAQAMKDEIRYGDEDSSFDDKEGGAMLLHLLMNTGIFGAGTFLKDMIDASEYGSSPLSVLLGPIPSKIADLISGLSSSNPRTVARSITSIVPLLGNIPIANSLRGDIVDGLEDILVDIGYERKRSTGGRIGYRAEGGQVEPTYLEQVETAKEDRDQGLTSVIDWVKENFDTPEERQEALKEVVNFVAPIGQIEENEEGKNEFTFPSMGEAGLMAGIGATLSGKGKKVTNVLEALKKSKLKEEGMDLDLILDDKGSPIVFGHGSKDYIKEFNRQEKTINRSKGKLDGFYFTSPEEATQYGEKVTSVNLGMKKSSQAEQSGTCYR